MESPDINLRIAARIKALRSARGMTIDALAAASGVSRSAISLIERGESSPTAVVLDKLAGGLGVLLATFFADARDDEPPQPLSRRAAQPLWRDPQSGYLRRRVSPGHYPSPIQIVEVAFPPGARVAYESARREPRVHQQIWVLEGAIEFTIGDERYRLETGDCLAMVLDRPSAFRNPTRKPARYAVVIATETSMRR